MDSDLDELSSYRKKIKELTDIQQYSIVSMLLRMETIGFQGVAWRRLLKNFKLATPQCSTFGAKQNSRSKKTTRGRKKKWGDEAINEAIREIPLKEKKNACFSKRAWHATCHIATT